MYAILKLLVEILTNYRATFAKRRAANVLIKHLPEMKTGLLEALDLIFTPKQIATQLALAVALESSMFTINELWCAFKYVASNFSTHSKLIRQLKEHQRSAESQDEWMDLAEQIDSIQGNDIWRTEKTCPLYESERIQSRIDELVR